ncbi:hypothetical protein [Haloferula sp. A504]|nr:hypothetical protein [Verrucomicrobiaceae bacterium E54]
MKTKLRNVLLLLPFLVFASCEDKSPAEEAADDIEDATEEVGDAVEEATD